MNAALPGTAHAPSLVDLALAAFEQGDGSLAGTAASEGWRQWMRAAPEIDDVLRGLALRYPFSRVELVALALTAAAETDGRTAHALSELQAPLAGRRPHVGLVVRAAQLLDPSDPCTARAHLASLYGGPARALGLFELPGDGPLIERPLRMVPALALALMGAVSRWPEIEQPPPPAVALAASTQAEVARWASAVRGSTVAVLRGPWRNDLFSMAVLLASAWGLRALPVVWPLPTGAGVWLELHGQVPVLSLELAPGETRELAAPPGYHGPLIVITGPDGSVRASHGPVWSLSVPETSATERSALWRAHGFSDGDARHLARRLRVEAGRLAALGQAAVQHAALQGRAQVQRSDVAHAARHGVPPALGAQAEQLRADVEDDALVLPPALRENLHALLARCEHRSALANGLGPALRTRYRPGVRALFTGASGTGKTLAAGWLATRLGLPLFRVDLAAVVSKYIGETEKNLAQLFAHAEAADLVLLFDEADALFGKRTDVKDANDRFANQQTNYLLQRIESFEGIALLTSNSRGRFDSAFTRRLDAILEFPLPGPTERLALWVAHLGPSHALDVAALNRLAACCDLAGGHVRTAVLSAAALAAQRGDALQERDVLTAVVAEYQKLGKLLPSGLAGPHAPR